MHYFSPEEIDQLTTNYRESVIQPDGSHRIGGKYSAAMHFDMPNLNYDTLCELPRYLVRTTVFPRGCRYDNADKHHYLMWIAEVSHYSEWGFEHQDPEYQTQVETSPVNPFFLGRFFPQPMKMLF